MLNVVALMGRLVADPELRHTPNGPDWVRAVRQSSRSAGAQPFDDLTHKKRPGSSALASHEDVRVAVVFPDLCE